MIWNRYKSRLRPVMEAEGAGAGAAGQGGAGNAGGGGQVAQPPAGAQPQSQQTAGAQEPPAIDYDKLAGLINGAQAAKEDAVLKSYFKQQGLSQEEVTQAITTFKTQKAAQQPDAGVLKQEAEAAKLEATQKSIENKAILTAIDLGLDAKKIPYALKLADFTEVEKDGKVDDEKMKAAINKVLEDIPEWKPAAAQDGKPAGYTPRGGAAPKTSRAAEIAAERNKSNQANPFADAWGQK